MPSQTKSQIVKRVLKLLLCGLVIVLLMAVLIYLWSAEGISHIVTILAAFSVLTICSIVLFRRYMYRLASYRFYWEIKSVARTVQFKIKHLWFRLTTYSHKSRGQLFSIFPLLLTAGRKLVLGTVLTILLFELCKNPPIKVDQFFLLHTLTQNVPQENSSTYDGILIAVLTFLGIFIPLYLTNLTSAIEEKYSELPDKIRALIFAERIENVAIQFVFFLIAYNLVALIYSAAIGLRPLGPLLLAAAFGGLSIPLLFVHFARQSSVFLDPTALSGKLLEELINWANHSTTRGFAWSDLSFQQHYHQQANAILQSLEVLVDIGLTENYPRREVLLNLVSNIISRFLPAYLLLIKQHIPANSRWFEQVVQFKDWYLGDITQSSSILIANSTQTNLPPNSSPDFGWLEKKLLGLSEKSIGQLVNEKDFDSIYRILDTAQNAFSSLGAAWAISVATRSLEKISHYLYGDYLVGKIPDSLTDRTKTLAYLQGVSNLNMLGVNILLAFFKTTQNIDTDKLSRLTRKIDWNKKESIYELDLPRSMLTGLEYLIPRIQFELEVEGIIISSNWYVYQLALQGLAESLENNLDQLLQLGQDFYISNSNLALRDKMFTVAMITATSGLEYMNKFTYHETYVRELAKKIEEKRILKEIKWPKWDWDSIEKHQQMIVATLVEQVAKCIPGLGIDEIALASDTPDWLGQALNIVGQRYFYSLLKNQPTLANSLFEYYFMGILRKHELINGKLKNWENKRSSLLYGTRPFAELLELSGYAYLFAEYHQNPKIWDSCKDTWDRYLHIVGQRESVLQIISAVSLANKHYAMTARHIVLTNWQQETETLLRQLPVVQLGDTSEVYFNRLFVRNHPSLLIRTIADIDMGLRLPNAIMNIFVELYLENITPVATIKHYRSSDIKERLVSQQTLETKYHFNPRGNGADTTNAGEKGQ